MNRYEPTMRELDAQPLGYGTTFGDNTSPIHLTELQIQEAERQMGGRFPDDYREFIRDFGGFCPYADYPIHFSRFKECSIDVFYSIISDEDMEAWDIVRMYISACRHSETWYEDWLHLGSTGGPTIAYAFKGPNAGSVYTFDFDYEPVLIARSFDEFMGLLYEGENKIYDLEAYNRLRQEPSFWDTFSTE